MAFSESSKAVAMNNSRQARNYLREVMGRYWLGKDLHPRAKILTPPEQINPRVRPVAAMLTSVWDRIDADNARFDDGLSALFHEFEERGDDAQGAIFTTSGQNAMNFGVARFVGGEKELFCEIVPNTTGLARFRAMGLHMAGRNSAESSGLVLINSEDQNQVLTMYADAAFGRR